MDSHSHSGSLTRSQSGVGSEDYYNKYEALKEEYEELLKRYTDLVNSHSGNLNKLELAQEENARLKKLHDDALQETNNAIRERNGLKQQCTAAIRQWDSALREKTEYKEALGKVQQQHEEAMKEINSAMAVRIKSNKDIKRLTEERDAALHEYSLIMSERDSVIRELEKLTEDLSGSKKQLKNLEAQNKEMSDKVQEVAQEADVSKRRRDWAFSERDLVLVERDKIVRERESLRTLCDRLRRERDRAVSDLAEALSESEDIKKQKNMASKQLKELKEKVEMEKENRTMRMHYNFSGSSSFSESRDSAIDSDMPSGHYSIKLPNMRGTDHGIVLEPGVYISRILPGSPASHHNLSVGDRIIYINDVPIDNVQDAILALSEDNDPILLTLSRSAVNLSSPISNTKSLEVKTPMSSGGTPRVKEQRNSASNSSLKSDKSDPNINNLSRRHNNSGLSKSGGLRDIFRVKIPRKISNEEDVLATLDSAIDSGGMGIGLPPPPSQQQQQSSQKQSSGSGSSKKTRKKRGSSRNAASANVGTWPRVPLNSRNSNCSYTLPHNSAGLGGGGAESDYYGSTTTPRGNFNREGRPESLYYGQGNYVPLTNIQPSLSIGGSNTVSIRRPGSSGGKERTPISSFNWDLGHQASAKSVGSIITDESRNLYDRVTSNNTRINSGPSSGGLPRHNMQSTHQNQLPSQPHRYSFGVFDQNYGKINKMAPERNSVVPTLTLSDGSSIDFSVKSGNMEILEYYVKRMVKNQNSSESDYLDKVVTPPSLAISHSSQSGGGGGGPGNSNGHSSTSPLNSTSTLDRYRTTSSSSRPIHHHENILPLNMSMPGGGVPSKSGAMSMPIQNVSKSSNSFSFEPSYHSHQPHSHHEPSASSTSMSLGAASNKMSLFRNSDDFLLNNTSYPLETSGTFPRKREPQRIRIPSNQSSRSSMEKFDLRNSPMTQMPTYHIEVLDPGNPQRSNPSDFGTWPRKPSSGELRKVRIDKSTEPLGIQISCKGNGGGVFVSSISQNSLAEQVGLQIGDQLLEICGINMRSATYNLAANVLRQCGDSITMLVQYAPDKYKEYKDGYSSGEDSRSHSDDEGSSESDDENNNSSLSESGSRSGSPTPTFGNSPQSTLRRSSQKGLRSSAQSHHSQIVQQQLLQQQNSQMSQNPGGTLGKSSGSNAQATYSSSLVDNPSNDTSLVRSPDGKIIVEKPRYITLQLMKNSSNLGICLVGGNIVGIFIHSVQPDSIADRAGLRTSDQILEYNKVNLRESTAEEAAFELAKPLDSVVVLVQYNLQKYNDIKDKPGDGFYVRALFDQSTLDHHGGGGVPGEPMITFHKDEILYIDNTMFNGKPGKWRAWKVDSEGHRRNWGIIPSKFKVEEEMMFKRTLGDLEGDRRNSTISRRSFFRRKSHHRSSSRELASFSDFSYGEMQPGSGINIKDEVLNSYQRVERLDFRVKLRPVLIIGPLSELIAERLVQDFPYQFGRVSPEIMHCSGQMLEKGLKDGLIIDFKRKGSHYECITMAAIKNTSADKLYCLLDISTAGVERLQAAQLYPIVILVKFKSSKQIREIKDPKCDKDKAKAKELYLSSLKVESEYKHLITSVCLSGGSNISYLAMQVKQSVETESSRICWIPVV